MVKILVRYWLRIRSMIAYVQSPILCQRLTRRSCNTAIFSFFFFWFRSPRTPIRGRTPVRQTDQPRRTGKERSDSSPERRGHPSPPKTQDCRCRPRCDFYWPPLLPRSARPSSSLVFITRVTNNSISIHFCSDWSMRETIVSGMSCAPTARPTASLATLQFKPNCDVHLNRWMSKVIVNS